MITAHEMQHQSKCSAPSNAGQGGHLLYRIFDVFRRNFHPAKLPKTLARHSERSITFAYFHLNNVQRQINIQNKKARFEYHLEDKFVAGICLTGTEVKSIRNGKASILEAYCVVDKGEVWIRNMHISAYENGSYYNHKPRADRKLLLNRKEINKIEKFLKVKGNTVVPLKMFISEKGWAKLEIALARGKKLHDKRQDLKEKDDKRAIDRALKGG